MSNWGSKSNQSISASTLLIEKDLPNQSVHCSYYSCVQYVFHVLNSHFGMDIAEVERDSQSSYSGTGTHKWLRSVIFKSIKGKNKIKAQRFYDDMGEMYDARAKSDYRHDYVHAKEAQKINDLAVATVSFLREHYEL